MITRKRTKNFPLLLTWAACLCGLSLACDEDLEAPDLAVAAEHLHVDEAEAREVRDDDHHHAPGADDGCFAGQREPVTLTWDTAVAGQPALSVAFADGAPGARTELQFHRVTLPVGPEGAQPIGAPVVLNGDARVRVPDSLLAATRPGAPHLVYALVNHCAGDSSGDECLVRSSDTLHVEDRRARASADHRAHLRGRLGVTRPDLVADGVITAVIDMKGL